MLYVRTYAATDICLSLYLSEACAVVDNLIRHLCLRTAPMSYNSCEKVVMFTLSQPNNRIGNRKEVNVVCGSEASQKFGVEVPSP